MHTMYWSRASRVHRPRAPAPRAALRAARRSWYESCSLARPLKRVIQKYIEDPLSEEVVRGRFKEGGIVEVRHSGEELTFSLKKDMVESALNDRV